MDKNVAAGWVTKIPTLLMLGSAVLAGNVIFWAKDVISGRNIPVKWRAAIFLAGLAMAYGVHIACEFFLIVKLEWMIVYSCSIFTEHILRFLYVEFWDIVKSALKNMLSNTLKRMSKNGKI